MLKAPFAFGGIFKANPALGLQCKGIFKWKGLDLGKGPETAR